MKEQNLFLYFREIFDHNLHYALLNLLYPAVVNKVTVEKEQRCWAYAGSSLESRKSPGEGNGSLV